MAKDKLQKLLDEGYILGRAIVDVVGKPKEHIEGALKLVLDRLKEDKNIMCKEYKIFEAKEQEGLWTTFAEVEILFKDMKNLILFCFDYMPSSIEIIEPADLKMDAHNLTDMLNDFLASLHDIGMRIKNLNAEKELLNRNASALLRNIIVITLRERARTLEEIADYVAIPAEQLKPFLDVFVSDRFLKFENNRYALGKR